jgi:arsenite-transporting ATPase
MDTQPVHTIGLLNRPTRHMFFTGKGGVGKTSLSTAALPPAGAGADGRRRECR